MSTIKRLLPTQREKKRYLAYHVISHHKIPTPMIEHTIKNKLTTFLGVTQTADAAPHLIKTTHDHTGILKIHPQYLNHARTALMTITHINNEPVLIRTLGVSGIHTHALHHITTTRGTHHAT